MVTFDSFLFSLAESNPYKPSYEFPNRKIEVSSKKSKGNFFFFFLVSRTKEKGISFYFIRTVCGSMGVAMEIITFLVCPHPVEFFTSLGALFLEARQQK